MTLVIDCQVLHTPSLRRGIGRYSLELLAHLRQALPAEEFVLLVNADLVVPDDLRTTLAERVPGARLLPVSLLRSSGRDNAAVQRHNTEALDRVLGAEGLAGADFLILSLFLGDGPCPVFPTSAARKSMMFYDIIPFLYRTRYLRRDEVKEWYFSHYRTLFDADVLLAISGAAAEDLIVQLGVPPQRIVCVGGAAVPPAPEPATRPPTVETERFVLMPTAADARKNNVRAVRAFESFRRSADLDLDLVVTSAFPPGAQQELRGLSDRVIFTGFVSDAELAWLYSHAAAVLFVSEYEGLGLPVLEAVEAGKPIVCSDIAAFREISSEVPYFCDPENEESIAGALHRALVAEAAEFDERFAKYPAILGRFNWPLVADRVKAGLAVAVSERRRERPRVAVLAPSPAAQETSVGRFAQALHAALVRYVDADYFLDTTPRSRSHGQNYLTRAASTFDIERFTPATAAEYEVALFHLAAEPALWRTCRAALDVPGVVVLHDVDLGPLLDGMVARNAVRSRDLGSLVNRHLAVVVHSDHARKAVEEVLLEPKRCHVLDPPVRGGHDEYAAALASVVDQVRSGQHGLRPARVGHFGLRSVLAARFGRRDDRGQIT